MTFCGREGMAEESHVVAAVESSYISGFFLLSPIVPAGYNCDFLVIPDTVVLVYIHIYFGGATFINS